MNLIEIVALISFLGCLFIVGLKLWNIGKLGDWYAPLWIFVSFGGYLIFWFLSFAILVSDPATDLALNGVYRLFFTLNSILLFICGMLVIIELLLKFMGLAEMVKEYRFSGEEFVPEIPPMYKR